MAKGAGKKAAKAARDAASAMLRGFTVPLTADIALLAADLADLHKLP